MRCSPSTPSWKTSAFVLVASLAVVSGCSVATLQAGLESPPEEARVAADDRAQLASEPPGIMAYPVFSVAGDEGAEVTVHYREGAEATANVLLVHGAGGGAWAWEYFLEHLPADYNVYALSWRGHFDSAPSPDARSRDHVGDQKAVVAAIERRNSAPIHLVGHSYGGATCVLQAADDSERFASLTLLAPVVSLDYTFAQRLFIPWLAPMFIQAGNDPDGAFGGMFLAQSRMRRYHKLYAWDGSRTGGPSLIRKDGVSPAWQRKLESAYESVTRGALPILMIVARYDNVVVPRRQRNAAAHAGIWLLQVDCGHYIPLDVEARVSVDHVARFLRANSR